MNNELQTQSSQAVSSTAVFNDDLIFNRMHKVAEMMASGRSTIPKHLRGSVGDCFAVVMQAALWQMNPYAVAQKTHLVGDTLGYEGQLVNAVITSMAPTKDRLNFEWFGDWSKVLGKFVECPSKSGNGTYKAPAWKPEDEEGLSVRVWATLKGEDSPRNLELLLTQAQVRNSTLWASDPKQQLAYLAIKRWSRLYCPDVIMGVYTPDELVDAPIKDMGDAVVVDLAEKKSGAVSSAKEKAKARAATAKAAKAKSEPEPAPETGSNDLQAVLDSINNAVTPEDFKKAADDAAWLSEEDQVKARELYAKRIHEVKEAARINTETGEIKPKTETKTD